MPEESIQDAKPEMPTAASSGTSGPAKPALACAIVPMPGVVGNMAQFFDAVLAVNVMFGSKPWWRGHAKSEWNVTPSIYHKGKAGVESYMAVEFVRRGAVRVPNPPAANETAGWLFLMQHYGLPTRLLDWSESALVALFFAVREREYHDSDGALWALAAIRLNSSQGLNASVYGVGTPEVAPIVNDALSFEKKAARSIAIITNHTDLRQMVQASHFTIHGEGKPLEEYPNANQFLIRIIVPRGAKAGLKADLDTLGICESSLFPDLDHLAKDIAGLNFLPIVRN